MTDAATTPRSVRVPTVADLGPAWTVVSRHLPPTPVDVPSEGEEPILKMESLQPTGSFKVRGALNALGRLDPGVPVVTASAGNHGLGVAYAARLLGRRATVVVSTKASPAKTRRLRALGIDLVQVGETFDEAEGHALGLARQGAYYMSGYNDPDVIAGQATIGFELDQQLDGELTVVCSIGGGGLASGLGLWASTRPHTRIIGVEADASTAVSATVRAGHDVTVEIGDTLADGMAGNIEPGCVTPGLIASHVSELITVDEEEIRAGMRYLVAERGYVAEGAGATAVAAIIAGKVASQGRTVAIVSGRNVTMPTLASVLGATPESG
jgi:threonine dehydratase